MPSNTKIVPVLLAGGTGSRLWPLSRESMPKQFQALWGTRTLLQEGALRVAQQDFGRLIVVANAEHRFLVAEQLRDVEIFDSAIVLEPVARATASAAAVAALLAARDDPAALILLAPADHVIADQAGFAAAVTRAAVAARGDRLTLFGIKPTNPATGYGYIRIGAPLSGAQGAFQVAAFVEKPDLETARTFHGSGDYLWNSGIFLLPAQLLLEELERFEPAVLAACRSAVDRAITDLDFLRLDPESFAASPAISLDHAVMERTDLAAVIPAEFGWSDVGSWSALWDLGEKDANGNVIVGDVQAKGSSGCYIRTEGPLVTTIGVQDLIVTVTEDAVLVARKDADQDVKDLVETLRGADHPAATQTKRVGRPWGFYKSVHEGSRFQVKRITVNPGAKLSLQKHFHRAEHWVVVSGTAVVTRDGEEMLLRENESVFVPLGCVHRLHNPGKVPLHLIEVQSGTYLGEDDIVRVEDIYSRG